MNSISFFCPGIPQTAGSKRAFPLKKAGVFTGRVAVTDDNPRSRDWKTRVAQCAQVVMDGAPLLSGPVEVCFVYRMPRLRGHYRANGELKPNAPLRPIVRPDLLKLSRAVEDALTGVVWRDDSQIVIEHLEKLYGDKPGVDITVTPLEESEPEPLSGHAAELALDLNVGRAAA